MKADTHHPADGTAGPGPKPAARPWSHPARSLAALLGQYRVIVEPTDAHTVRFLAVPVGRGFSKERTNLLLRRLPANAGAAAFVDGDLRYAGADRALARALSGPARQDWRRLRLPLRPGAVESVLCQVLERLGSPLAAPGRALLEAAGDAPCGADAPALGPTLAAIGRPIGRRRAARAFEMTCRRDLAVELAVAAARPQPPNAVVLWGPAGAGKDLLLRAVAHCLLDAGRVAHVVRVSGGAVAAGSIFPPEVDASLLAVLTEARAEPGLLLLAADLDACLTRSPACGSILCDAIDDGLRLLATCRSERALSQLQWMEGVARRILPVYVGTPDRRTVQQMLEGLAAEAPVPVEPTAVHATLRLAYDACPEEGEPARSIGLLAAAIARAGWHGGRVDPDAIFAVPQPQWPERLEE